MTAEEELRQKTDPKYLSYLRTINESKSSGCLFLEKSVVFVFCYDLFEKKSVLNEFLWITDLKLEEESRNQAMNAKTEYVRYLLTDCNLHTLHCSQAVIFDSSFLNRNRAFVDKKATEIFLQNLIFQLSDVLIFVQHEMTWTDQQMLHILQLKIGINVYFLIGRRKNKNRSHQISLNDVLCSEQIASSQSSNYPRNPLIVIHNFKTTKTRQEFKSLRRVCNLFEIPILKNF
jgi:hypothetical protein